MRSRSLIRKTPAATISVIIAILVVVASASSQISLVAFAWRPTNGCRFTVRSNPSRSDPNKRWRPFGSIPKKHHYELHSLLPSASDKGSSTSTSSKLTYPRETISNKDRAIGIAVLLTVPLCWGTYGPAVKYLYALPSPVPGLVFSAAYYMVAAVTLLGLLGAISLTETTTGSESTRKLGEKPWKGGIELGTYLFVGNVLQVIGLQTVQADRAGFLVQLTTIMVPILEASLAGKWTAVSNRTWMACLIAFSGVVVIDLDGPDFSLTTLMSQSPGSAADTANIAALFGLTNGDMLIVAAAFAYSLHVVRLERYARETTALQLATAKACIEAVLSVGLVTGLVLGAQGSSFSALTSSDVPGGLSQFALQTGQEITSFFAVASESIASGSVTDSALGPAVGAVLWTGWVTCAYTIFAQSFGQGRVKPTDANLIYTVQPLFTALFAFFLLRETMGPAGMLGGFLIALAVYLVATMNDSTQSDAFNSADERRYD